jgi:hypothetical protein
MPAVWVSEHGLAMETNWDNIQHLRRRGVSMSVWGWAFVVLNFVVCVGCLWSTKWSYNAHGDREQWGSPANWIFIWQLVGVGLVVGLNFSPWHLIWWFVVGIPVSITIGKVLMRFGYYNP